MRKNKYSADQVRAMIAERCASSKQYQVAAQLGITAPYLSNILRGGREPGPRMLHSMGLRKIVLYETID